MRFAALSIIVLVTLGCRPITHTDYVVETHGPAGFTQERIDPRLDRYTVYRIDTLNNGKRKDTPLVDIDP